MADLFDVLSGVDRPRLDAFVANSQATNSLRSAQTDEAIQTAMQKSDELAASRNMRGSLSGLTKDDGTPMFTNSEVNYLHDVMVSKYGNATNAMQSLGDAQKAINTLTLSNPANLNKPADTAAQAGNENKVPVPTSISGNYAVPAGITPNVQTSTIGQATINQKDAAATHALKTAQNGFLDPTVADFEGYKYWKTNKLPNLGMGGAQAKQQIMSVAADLANRNNNGENVTNPAYENALANGQDFVASQRTLNSEASGSLGDQAQRLNNAVGHMALLDKMFTALQNGDTQAINSLGNAWKKAFGSSVPTNIQAAASIVGPEINKALVTSGAGGQEERANLAQLAGNLANSPEQAHGALQTMTGLLGRQADDLALRYHGATGRTDFAHRYLAPDTIGALNLTPGGGGPGTSAPPPGQQAAPLTPPGGPAPSGGPAPGKPIVISGDADFTKLPSGALFVGPDGHVRRKP